MDGLDSPAVDWVRNNPEGPTAGGSHTAERSNRRKHGAQESLSESQVAQSRGPGEASAPADCPSMLIDEIERRWWDRSLTSKISAALLAADRLPVSRGRAAPPLMRRRDIASHGPTRVGRGLGSATEKRMCSRFLALLRRKETSVRAVQVLDTAARGSGVPERLLGQTAFRAELEVREPAPTVLGTDSESWPTRAHM